MHILSRFIASILVGLSLFISASLVSAQPSPSPSASPKVEFRLVAGVGKFPPGSPLAFMDNVVNNLKLFFKFNTNDKIMKHMDIADKDIVHMKMALEEDKLDNLQAAVTKYKQQIAAIRSLMLKNTLNADMRGKLEYRILLQEQAFNYLLINSDDKEDPVTNDAWSQLQNFKLALTAQQPQQ